MKKTNRAIAFCWLPLCLVAASIAPAAADDVSVAALAEPTLSEAAATEPAISEPDDERRTCPSSIPRGRRITLLEFRRAASTPLASAMRCELAAAD